MLRSARKRFTEGFTLVEILVSVVIISIIVTISVGAMAGMQKSSRDGKRKADLRIIQSALEEYRADQHYYPAALTPGAPLQSPDISKTYLRQIPSDPSSGSGADNYCYLSSPTSCSGTGCVQYSLFAGLENTPAVPPPCPLSSCNGKCYNFQVYSP